MACENKGILFCAVMRGDQLLSHCSCVDGNFIEFTRKILEKSDNASREKATYAIGNHMLHYVRDGAIMYLCVTDDEFERSKAFLFLSDIRKRFVLHREPSKSPEEVSFESTIAEQMEYYSKRFLPQLESINTYRNQLDELEEIEVKDIGSLAGDRIRLLPFTSANFDLDDCVSVTDSGRFLEQCSSCSPNCRIMLCIFITFTILVIVAFCVVIAACEGFKFKNCKKT